MQIDRFTVCEPLSVRRGIASFLVQHRSSQSFHALKVLPAPDPEVARILTERAWQRARIVHPHVVAVTDVLAVAGGVGLVMEHAEGTTLNEILIDGEGLPRSEIIPVFLELLSGLSAAHQLGIAHHELCPGNILLSATSDGVHTRLSDFVLGETLVDARGVTLSEGEPGYTAPDRLTSSFDPRVDVFSLGCILYELCVGHGPYTRSEPASARRAAASGSHTPLQALAPDLPAILVDLVDSAISPVPSRRPATVNHMEEALRSVDPRDLHDRIAREPRRPRVGTLPPTYPEPSTLVPENAPTSLPRPMIELPPPTPAPAYLSPTPSAAPPAPNKTEPAPAAPPASWLPSPVSILATLILAGTAAVATQLILDRAEAARQSNAQVQASADEVAAAWPELVASLQLLHPAAGDGEALRSQAQGFQRTTSPERRIAACRVLLGALATEARMQLEASELPERRSELLQLGHRLDAVHDRCEQWEDRIEASRLARESASVQLAAGAGLDLGAPAEHAVLPALDELPPPPPPVKRQKKRGI